MGTQQLQLTQAQETKETIVKKVNPLIIDQSNGKQVKSIYFVKTGKLGRDVKRMMWQYYRDRYKTDANEIMKQFNRQKKEVHTMEIIYSGDPVIHRFPRTPVVPKKKRTVIKDNSEEHKNNEGEQQQYDHLDQSSNPSDQPSNPSGQPSNPSDQPSNPSDQPSNPWGE